MKKINPILTAFVIVLVLVLFIFICRYSREQVKSTAPGKITAQDIAREQQEAQMAAPMKVTPPQPPPTPIVEPAPPPASASPTAAHALNSTQIDQILADQTSKNEAKLALNSGSPANVADDVSLPFNSRGDKKTHVIDQRSPPRRVLRFTAPGNYADSGISPRGPIILAPLTTAESTGIALPPTITTEATEGKTSVESSVSPPPFSKQSTKPVQLAAHPDHLTFTVYYGTDRTTTGSNSTQTFYSGQAAAKVAYGTCRVTIPYGHHVGQIEGPAWWNPRAYDPKKDITVQEIDPCADSAEFVTRLGGGLSNSAQKEIFLFIHGFDNTFFDAARRTAQLAYDSALANHPIGIPVLYSFPSLGNPDPISYRHDANQMDASSYRLAEFLFTLHQNFPNVPINVVAHSMGNHLLCAAISKYKLLLADQVLAGTKSTTLISFGEVALEAPDEDERAFTDDLGVLKGLCQRTTFYGCSRDLGIEISELLNQGDRIGDTSKKVFVATGLDSIDATAIADVTGHEYYALNPDIPFLFMHWTIAQRKLKPGKNGPYYILAAQPF